MSKSKKTTKDAAFMSEFKRTMEVIVLLHTDPTARNDGLMSLKEIERAEQVQRLIIKKFVKKVIPVLLT